MAAIIFGAGGQDGFYLSALLKQKNIEVIGISRQEGFIHINMGDYKNVSDLIRTHRPEYIFHLAANSTTRHEALFENHTTIATGTLNILESVKHFSPHTKVFISGSGLQFKNENKPIKETDTFESRDAYSVSRIQSVYAARYFRSFGIKAYVGYFFNHDSPRRSERHIAKKIATAAKHIAAGKEHSLEIGNINVVKEWGYAGDIVKGVWQFVSQDNIFEVNISTGLGYSIKDWLKECFDITGKDFKSYLIEKDNFIAEYDQLVSDASLIRSIGFTPQVSFSQLARLMMSDEPA